MTEYRVGNEYNETIANSKLYIGVWRVEGTGEIVKLEAED